MFQTNVLFRLVAGTLLTTAMLTASAQDIAILNGRVMDPETGLDAIRHILVREGRIHSISEDPPSAASSIDAAGLVVAPGFIDLHAHGQDLPSNRFQAGDGVTTALELEIGAWPVERYYEQRKDKALLNYGATVSHVAARHAAVEGLENIGGSWSSFLQQSFAAESARRQLSQTEIDDALALMRGGMRQGALGFGFGITYTPGAAHEEIFQAFNTAAELEAPVFVHVRAASRMGGDRLAPVQEVIANAVATRASLHIVHLNSSTDKSAMTALEMIRGARRAGLDITTEAYPYTAGSTLIESALFDDWQADYGLLQWAKTGERLTRESFDAYRKTGGAVIIHGRSEEANAWLIRQPDVIIASDGISFANGASHPRGAGTYAKTLGHFVRESEALDLMSALEKMTLLPARRLEAIAPEMKRKGRVQVGADADLTVFDPNVIIDKATYTDSMQLSAGIRHVLVNGVFVLRDAELVEGIFPGKPVYGRLQE